MKKAACALIALIVFGACSPGGQDAAIDCVDPFIGTGFHGHTYPGATVPQGAVQLSPDTRAGNWDACSGYHYDDTTLKGFSHTHLSGTGCIDLGDILFRPTCRMPDFASNTLYRPARFSHQDETASPGYYAVTLPDEGIKAELTATKHVGVHRYSFPAGKPAIVIVDLAHLLNDEFIYEASLQQTSDNEITGMRRTRGWTDNQYVYFVARFSHPIHRADFVKDGQKTADTTSTVTGNNLQAVLSFDLTDGQPLTAHVGLSIVSEENARLNLETETEGLDFDSVHAAARREWEQALSTICVEGGTADQRKTFYTALYHTLIVPNTVSDVNGAYRRHDMQIDTTAAGHVQYSTFSLWDTFRAWHPLVTLTDTALVCDMINSFLNIYDASGELPIWPLSAGETGTMIGYHSVSVIADAYLKGIRGFDAGKALEAMQVSAEKSRKGADYYVRNGFIPADIKNESVSCLLEFAYDDWCIARMAQEMGKNEVADTFLQRSQNYINVFDGSTRFFRPKRLDGNWVSPFNPFEISAAYTEATAWQYRFFVPHDVNGMIQQFGGTPAFTAALDSLFTVSSEMEGELVDITGLLGQYAHGNEPSHHIAYLYSYVGQPWKTQAMTRRLLDEMYTATPGGLIGNEDCGQMSAWYILTALGFYSVCPGSNEFVLTTPLFDKAVMKLANGKTLTVVANNPRKNTYIQRVELNGRPIDANYLTYAQLMEGGELRFTLTDTPNMQRGTSPETFPYSYTSQTTVSIPYINQDVDRFAEKITVTLGTATDGAEIRYTLDGSEPTQSSPRYEQPLAIDKTLTLKAKGFKEGFQPSRTLSIKATRATMKAPLAVHPTKNGTRYQYYEGNYRSVNDMMRTAVVQQGILPAPSITGARQEDYFGFVFTGLIEVPEDGVYTFQTRSDDGSMLYIDGEPVVDNDGSHSAATATGRIALKQGFHSYKLLYIERYDGQELNWTWKLPSASDQTEIPASALFVQ